MHCYILTPDTYGNLRGGTRGGHSRGMDVIRLRMCYYGIAINAGCRCGMTYVTISSLRMGPGNYGEN